MLDPTDLPISYDQAAQTVRDACGILVAYVAGTPKQENALGMLLPARAGTGEWTRLEDFAAELVALAEDLRATAKAKGKRPAPRDMMRRAEAWLGRPVAAWHEVARPKGAARLEP